MSIYTQQINNIVEQMPITDQQFVLELVKKISNSSIEKTTEKMPNQKEAVRKFIEAINAVEPLPDDELDEILIKGISLRSSEEMDLL